MKKVKIISNDEIAQGIFLLEFHRFFEFIPGQVVKITTENSLSPRMYSIASGNGEENISILYDVKPEGELTNQLKKLHKDDELFVSQPFGNFICSENNAWWIATGTGIAPFYSMFRSGRFKNVTLIHGVRKAEQFLFRNEFTSKLNNKYLLCCSGQKIENAFHGRVTEFLRQITVPDNTNFYLCGNAEMVVDVRDILIERGVPFGKIFSEIYF